MNIPVTKPFLPPYNEYTEQLKGVWERNWLTNNGPLVNELELELKKYLGLDHLLFMTNGTIALQIAIKALNLNGEIITTPFSYVATTSSIVWENCQPTMVDIDEGSLNIDPAKIEAAITPKTSAILATHVFGNPCKVDEIDKIAKKNNLSVIYDAAHAFGTTYRGKSLLSYGDVSTCSFHATKLFHTIEGGSVSTNDAQLLRRMAMMRNFGHVNLTEIEGVGINGKNSEVHAAMGICNLKYIDEVIKKRKLDYNAYKSRLSNLPVEFQVITNDTEYNFSYFPVIFESEEILLKVQEQLNLNKIYPRRYFYPALSNLPYVTDQNAVTAENISKRILCLPLYSGITIAEIDMICRYIKRTIRY
jgi:dTDP-4-amino-4,6-dideoxygalactose transaminase